MVLIVHHQLWKFNRDRKIQTNRNYVPFFKEKLSIESAIRFTRNGIIFLSNYTKIPHFVRKLLA